MMKYMQGKRFHNKKTSKPPPYIDATFQIQFFPIFDERESCLQHVVAFENARLFIQSLPSENEDQL